MNKLKEKLYRTLKDGTDGVSLVELRGIKIDELVQLEKDAEKVRKQIEFIDKQIR